MHKKIKVLMVDDEIKFRETTQKILDRKGFQTILAADGKEALEKLKDNPDVVILDIKMPGMDGHVVLKEIKKQKPALPVIMLTGHGALPSAEEAYISGAFDYLAKPCDIELLTDRIEDACHTKNAERDRPERMVNNVMVPLAEYTTIPETALVREAIAKLRGSFFSRLTTSRLMETGHRSVLVMDSRNHVIGILTIADLMEAIMPGYLSAPKPSMADSIEFSPMFWTGMFTREVEQIAEKQVHEVMSPAPMAISAEANLMEAAYMMIKSNLRRLVVTEGGKAIGVIREQDLFFEMERLLRDEINP
ncbi:MAG: response regulator [Desulfobacteraceae bacterium]|nr:MAG: response regulator [Desulfobacteraceae bacterium]